MYSRSSRNRVLGVHPQLLCGGFSACLLLSSWAIVTGTAREAPTIVGRAGAVIGGAVIDGAVIGGAIIGGPPPIIGTMLGQNKKEN